MIGITMTKRLEHYPQIFKKGCLSYIEFESEGISCQSDGFALILTT